MGDAPSDVDPVVFTAAPTTQASVALGLPVMPHSASDDEGTAEQQDCEDY